MNVASGLSHRNTRNTVALILYGAGVVVGIVAYWQFMTDPAIPVRQTTVALKASLLLFISAPIIRLVEKWHLVAINFLGQIVAVRLIFGWRWQDKITFSYAEFADLLDWSSGTVALFVLKPAILCLLSVPLAMLAHRMLWDQRSKPVLSLYLVISWILVVGAVLLSTIRASPPVA